MSSVGTAGAVRREDRTGRRRGGGRVRPQHIAAGRRARRRPVRALSLGITGVAAVPLHAGGYTFGAVDLMSATRPTLTERDLCLAQILADAAGAWLHSARYRAPMTRSSGNWRRP
ncbi:GAF domain-containing protein [Streptomyces poonensis]|uniref:GAF domain-containing protein n=1 Tax=Streptomyces poonensis TaxID=68255 RepID=A0A918PBS7_9ACTN|nr:hypothetical protein GCM10010365_12620 [Streptomyces poonensis]GLJ88793.1 hypothetical protein GCM10017589_13930 [Streptomyces poonensis]